MKAVFLSTLALACLLGLATAYYGYSPYYPTYNSGVGSGAGNGGFLALIGLLFVIMILFSTRTTSTSPSVAFVNVSG